MLVLAVLAMVALSGCATLDSREPSGGSDGPELPDGPTDVGGAHVQAADNATAATNANYTLRAEVNESTAGSELSGIGATFPRDHFVVDGAKHGAVRVGVDTDGDGTVDRSFDESHISGVNNNAFSFDVTLDTDYTLQRGDVVVVRYPHITNPDEAGEYPIAVRLNGDRQRSTGTITVG